LAIVGFLISRGQIMSEHVMYCKNCFVTSVGVRIHFIGYTAKNGKQRESRYPANLGWFPEEGVAG
jgi:hypothetical protein